MRNGFDLTDWGFVADYIFRPEFHLKKFECEKYRAYPSDIEYFKEKEE